VCVHRRKASGGASKVRWIPVWRPTAVDSCGVTISFPLFSEVYEKKIGNILTLIVYILIISINKESLREDALMSSFVNYTNFPKNKN